MDIGIGSSVSTLMALRDLLPRLRILAQTTDVKKEYPTQEMALLGSIGVFSAPFPPEFGGHGIGVTPGKGHALLTLLHLIGQASLPVARLVEAHINAIRIVMRYGSYDLQSIVSKAIHSGGLLGLWVTDPSHDGLTYVANGDRILLSGHKQFCSGAGRVTHAVVTASDGTDGPPRLLFLDLGKGETTSPLAASLSGMRGALTGQVDFTGVTTTADRLIGEAGDYMKEPDFSAGAWRSSAAALGGLYGILDQMRLQLSARGRQNDPHQRARFGQALLAHESGWLWLERAGAAAEDLVEDPARIVAMVGLARTVVERACLDGIELAQRSLGLSAFVTDNPVERMSRDLQTYLRQPAGDEVLHHAAGYFMLQGLPPI
jgi:alkylation response protein AidB-like acyl-CoA dehydrogenase